MNKERALRKGMNEKQATTEGGALAWLYRMYALISAMFTRDLPELTDVEESEAEPFLVIAWTTAHTEALEQIKRLGPILDSGVLVTEDGIEHVEIEASLDLYESVFHDPDTYKVLDVVRSDTPDRVDHMIAIMAKKWSGLASLTLRGPGIALRCNRKIRRAAISRERRANRRANREMARQARRAQ